MDTEEKEKPYSTWHALLFFISISTLKYLDLKSVKLVLFGY